MRVTEDPQIGCSAPIIAGVTPALKPAVMNLQLPARLTAQRAHASTVAQADRHHDPLGAEAHGDDGRPRQTQQPLERVATRTSSSFASR